MMPINRSNPYRVDIGIQAPTLLVKIDLFRKGTAMTLPDLVQKPTVSTSTHIFNVDRALEMSHPCRFTETRDLSGEQGRLVSFC